MRLWPKQPGTGWSLEHEDETDGLVLLEDIMRIQLAAALVALLLAGCAGHGAMSATDDTVLLECRAKADEIYKTRYTTKWEAAVVSCLQDR